MCYFETIGIFQTKHKNKLEGIFNKKYIDKKDVLSLLEDCKTSIFTITLIRKSTYLFLFY